MFEPKVTEDRRFLIVVRVDPADRAPAAKLVTDVIAGFSPDSRLAFSSHGGETFGIFVKAKRAAREFRAALDKQYTKADRAFVLVLELGEDWSAIGNSRGWEWLQHH